MPIERAPAISALLRRQIYARLLWLHDYRLVFAAERATNEPLMEHLIATCTSAHMRRLIQSGTTAGVQAAQAVEMRLRDCVGFLARPANVLHVPISQAARPLCSWHPTFKRLLGRRSARREVWLDVSTPSTCFAKWQTAARHCPLRSRVAR